MTQRMRLDADEDMEEEGEAEELLSLEWESSEERDDRVRYSRFC